MALQARGSLQGIEKKFEQCRQSLAEALEIFLDLKDQRQVAQTYREQGSLAYEMGDFTAARALYTQAIEIFASLEGHQEIALTRLELGVLEREQGNLAEARQILDEVLRAMRQMQDRRNVARALAEIGTLLLRQGQAVEALPTLLSAEVGLELVEAPERRKVKTLIAQARTQIGETALRAQVNHLANEAPEPVYELTPAMWAASIQKLMSEVTEYADRQR